MITPVKPSAHSPIIVSVIIPTFNRADLLRETVQSVLDQSRAPDEILVVDDGSDDHTGTVLAEFSEQIRVLKKKNSGKADSLNQAIAAITGTHIWIVDDDDLPRTDALSKLTMLMAANTGAEVVYGKHVRFSQEDQGGPKIYQETGYWDERGPEYFLIATLEDFFVHQPAMLASRSLYERAGPFNTDMIASEDYEMLIRLASHGQAASTDAIIFEQRVHAGVRGQKGHQFKASDRNAKWVEYDQRIFRAVYKTLSLTDYLPRGTKTPDAPAAQRRALIQRASIMGRKKLWSLAIEDLRAIVEGDLQTPLSDLERATLRRTLLSKYGCDELLDAPQIRQQLSALSSASPLGKALVGSIGRSLLWHFRTELSAAHPAKALGFARLYLTLR